MDRHKIIDNKNYYKNRLKIILPHLNLHAASILDLGCGEMILYDLVQNQIKSYVGIDRFSFSDNEHFVQGDILDGNVLKDYSSDFVFLLGVLDHLTFDEKVIILESCHGKFNNCLIISQRNPNSIINLFFKKKSPVIDLKKFFGEYSIAELYLLKLPITGFVFDLSRCTTWIRGWCTEIVYIISKKSE